MFLKSKISGLCFLLFIVLSFQGCDKNWDEHYNTLDTSAEKSKIIAEMEKIPEISLFTEAVKQLDTLVDLLSQNRLYTVFAPVNETFDSLNTALSANKELFDQMILYHFIDGKYKQKDFSTLNDVITFSNKYLSVKVDAASTVLIDNNAKISSPDFLSQNGMIQVIDKPLMPLLNLYQHYKFTSEIDKFYNAIEGYTYKVFDLDASTPVAIDENNNIVYDSVFNVFNPFLYRGSEFTTFRNFYGQSVHFVDFSNENDQFTAVIPSNFNAAVEQAKTSAFLKGDIDDLDWAGPVLSNVVFNSVMDKDEVIEDIEDYHASKDADTSRVQLYFADLLNTNYVQSATLSNGVYHVVDDMEYDLSWLITERGNADKGEKESDYLAGLRGRLMLSDFVDTAFVSLNNVKVVFSESTDSLGYQPAIDESATFIVPGSFYPVDYKVYVRGRIVSTGSFLIDVDGTSLGEYNFETAPSGDVDSKFNEIGTIGFTEKKASVNLKFRFVKPHSGAVTNTGNEYLWIREIKFVPVLK